MFDFHGCGKQPRERLAAGVHEHLQGPAAFAEQLQRPHRPRAIELVLQAELVSETIEAGG